MSAAVACQPEVEDERRCAWYEYIVLLCASGAADFFRRVAMPMRRWPCLLAWLVWAEPDVECQQRKMCVKDLLNIDEEMLNDDTTRKFRFIFFPFLKDASETGTLHIEIWQLVLDIFIAWALDTQEIEGSHNILKRVYKTATSNLILQSRIVR
jgi:hypothetical protein